MQKTSIAEIRALAAAADADGLLELEGRFRDDPRAGVAKELAHARSRVEREAAEHDRVAAMYRFDRELCGRDDELCMGLDEVGRGPIAGPLAVGAVVLPAVPMIEGINDSKQVPEKKREILSGKIKETALASSVVFIDAEEIDDIGITASLRKAFIQAITEIDGVIGSVGHVLLDGNPMHLDPRESNMVKGDAKSACIACASIMAKVARDEVMREHSKKYPEYLFDKNKGYGTEEHITALRQAGPCDIHRLSFCSGILQETLF